MKNTKHKKVSLDFIYGTKDKELWFVKHKFSNAQNSIGKERFAYIINQNIPDSFSEKNEELFNSIKKYIDANYESVSKEIEQKGKILKKRWSIFEKDFFLQINQITGLKLKYKIYKLYLLYSCFWGGDYDINGPNIYVNPLLKHGDPLYIIFHELSHLIYWEYIYKKYPTKFIKRNEKFLWTLSEIMVNYPLLKMKINFYFPLITPNKLLANSKSIIKKFATKNFIDLIKEEVDKNVAR